MFIVFLCALQLLMASGQTLCCNALVETLILPFQQLQDKHPIKELVSCLDDPVGANVTL